MLTERFRRLEALQKARIIVLSWESDARATDVNGADVVLYRPFSPERIRDELLRLLRGAV
jgi:PleD family two-component response regulator